MTTVGIGLSRRSARGAFFALGALLVIAVSAWLEIHHGVKLIAAVAVAGALGIALQHRGFGVLIGMALLVDLDGIPGLDTNPGHVAISHLQDLSGLAVLAGAFYVVTSGKVTQRSSLQRTLYWVSLCFGIWWMIIWVRSALFDGIPPVLAARYARDFLYFAVTLPLLCDVFVTYPRLRRQVILTLGVGASLFAFAQLVQYGSNISLDFILHPRLTSEFEGTTRIYSPMNGLIRAVFALSIGALILAPTRRLKRWSFLPAVVFGVAMLLQLTRAAYFGAAAGFGFAALIWWFRRGPSRAHARKQLILVPVLAICLLGFGAAASSAERQVISKVSARVATGFSDVNGGTGTVAARVTVTNEMLRLLGQDWPIGLGFLHPAAHYFPSLPNGSIRNSDVGVLNAVMLMGVVGAVLLYLPLLLVLRALTRGSPARGMPTHDEWLRLGAAIWIIGLVASSITLDDLYSYGGLQLAACLLALAASITTVRAGRIADVEE